MRWIALLVRRFGRAQPLVVACLALACGPRPTHVPSGSGRGAPGLHVTLYRDHSVVAHRIDVVIPAAAPTTIRLRAAAGIAPDDVYLVEKSDLVVREVRATTNVRGPPPAAGCDEVSCILDNYERPCCTKFQRSSEWEDSPKATTEKPATPTDIELVIGGPREGKYSLLVGYDTDRITWDAAYSMITTHAHDRVLLRGALAIRNATGLDLRDAHVRVVDTRHGTASQRATESAQPRDPNSAPVAAPRDIGRVDLLEGDTRIELLANATSRAMRSVLVFDPIGTALDYQHTAPVQDPNLGVIPPPATRVTESFEIDRAADTQHLPAGPVRLLERRPDGAVVLLGESNLFGTATLAAAVDTVAVGTAERVTAKRERRDLTVDNDRKRVVEEFSLIIDNKRERPVEVVLREHLYRGKNWTIAYRSVFDIVKEGEQQIAMRIAVPAKQKQTVLYVVVYSWSQ